MRRPPPEAAEMRGFALVLGAFEGEKGQGEGPTRRFFLVFPARGDEASTEIASWGLGAGRIRCYRRGLWPKNTSTAWQQRARLARQAKKKAKNFICPIS